MKTLKTIGWREWVALPELRVPSIKVKVDTGARTSSLHAFDAEVFSVGKKEFVRFRLQPEQRSTRFSVTAVEELIGFRHVRSSSGQVEHRPVIETMVELMGERWMAELTLTCRDEMGFRMLLGRQAVRHRFVVDPGRSFLNGKRVKGKRRLVQPESATKPAPKVEKSSAKRGSEGTSKSSTQRGEKKS